MINFFRLVLAGLALAMAGPDERRRESIKAKVGDIPFEPGSLFARSDNA